MSNNTVTLTGHLHVSQASAGGSARNLSPVVEGWISTADAASGGWHPFRAEDRQALVILERARLAGESARPAGVSVHARLVSHPLKSYLEIKFISFFDTSFPVGKRQDSFMHSSAALQGHLTIRGQSYLNLEGNDLPLSGLPACLATGTIAQGGQHLVLIDGEELAALRQDAHFQDAFRHQSRITLPAALSGTLYTCHETIYVRVNFLSLDTRPVQFIPVSAAVQPGRPASLRQSP